MITKILAVAIVGLFQLVVGQNVSLADPWSVKSVYFSDDGFTDLLTLTLVRGVILTHCSTAWDSLQHPGSAMPTEWMNCADDSLRFRIPTKSFVSTNDFVVHLLTTDYSKKSASNTVETLPIYETLVHFTNNEASTAFDKNFFTSKVLLDCIESRNEHSRELKCMNETGSGADKMEAFTINKLVEALRVSNIITKNNKRTLWQFNFVAEDSTQYSLASPTVNTNCHADWPTQLPPETTADHPVFCDDKNVSFYITAKDGLDINNGFFLHVDHDFEEVGDYPQFPVPMNLWFTVSGDAEFTPECGKCDERKRTCTFATEKGMRMNLTYAVSPTKPQRVQTPDSMGALLVELNPRSLSA